ncbi:MAG TPA: nucleotidyltransferase domain-containing protein [Ktedonobacteraceae bacterium]|nr:nucleotidyltransferase domain-containing protein [Ktedonobacteraceae bacterium]
MIDPAIHEMVRKIVLTYKPDRVLLFGSYAKGTQTPFSDIDLLVVKDTAQPRHRRGHELRQLFYGNLVSVDLLVYTNQELEDEMMEPHSFLSSIAQSWIEMPMSE